jgi:hypothetical protein
MDEAKLIDKVRRIEALFSGAATEGERVAAERARSRILQRLEDSEKENAPVEYRFPMADVWLRKVFLALLRRYGIPPYRYRGQRRTTVMARVPERFLNETLWPEFQEISEALRVHLSEVTERVVSQVIHQDGSEAEVVEKPMQLPLGLDEADPVEDPASPPPGISAAQQQFPSGQETGDGDTFDRGSAEGHGSAEDRSIARNRAKGARKKRRKRKRR